MILIQKGDTIARGTADGRYLRRANDLSDLDSALAALGNLGTDARYLQILNDLSDLANAATARANLGLNEPPYSSTMTGNEVFTYARGETRTYFLDPNGASRNFDPSGAFPLGFLARVLNVGGGFNIVFDSGGSIQTLTPGSMGAFVYDGTNWL